MVVLETKMHGEFAPKTQHFVRVAAHPCAFGVFLEVEEDSKHVFLTVTAMELGDKPGTKSVSNSTDMR